MRTIGLRTISIILVGRYANQTAQELSIARGSCFVRLRKKAQLDHRPL